jgi:hypothetical protein
VGDLPGIYVRMNGEMYDALNEVADAAGLSLAEIVRVALSSFLLMSYEPMVRGRKKVG